MRKKKKRSRVAVGISGGVDSSLAAALLVEQGYDVTGVHLVCYEEPGCRAPQDHKDALAVALQLGIPFEVLDFQKEYKDKVIEYFYREYEAGRTPNPDVVCNKEIKFGLFLDWAKKNGFDYVATGHYVRVGVKRGSAEKQEKQGVASSIGLYVMMSDRTHLYQGSSREHLALLSGIDSRKDQSYFLYTLNQERLKHILFPVGHLTKSEVRAEAKKRGLQVADKKDSVGVCFIGDIKVQEFLRRRIKEKKGEVVDTKGNIIGEHKGVWFYTIGQRVGFRIRISKALGKKLGLDPTNLPPFYVVSKDVTRNKLVVGTSKEAERDEFEVDDVHWIRGGIRNKELRIKDNLTVRIRHGGRLIPARWQMAPKSFATVQANGKWQIKLSEAQRGVAPGQSVVFYRGEECLGGGIIR